MNGEPAGPGIRLGDYPAMEWEQLLLRKRVAQVNAAISPQVAHDAEWSTYVDRLTDRMVVQLRSYVYGDKVDEITRTVELAVTVASPANWWQHLRERVLDERGWLDRAILRRWPIRYREQTETDTQTLTVERWNTFPDNDTVYPDNLGGIVRIQSVLR